jgi:hypothetical protein
MRIFTPDGPNVQANGVLEKDPLLVAGRYLRGWCLIDVLIP